MAKRGEIWLVDLGLAQKTRPALILSVAFGDADRALLTIVSHTTALRGSRFEVALPVQFLREGAFNAQSIVTIPVKHAIRKLGSLKPDELAAVEERVREWLGF
jgi:mRNA interferase MazF